MRGEHRRCDNGINRTRDGDEMMAWIFALGIIALGVFHRGFRRVALWTFGVSGALFTLVCAWGLIAGH